MRRALLLLGLAACEPTNIYRVPDDPDGGSPEPAEDGALYVPDSSTPPAPDAEPQPPCDPATHAPTACQAGPCYGAVLCVGGRLQCVTPACEDPDPEDDCDFAEYVFIIDRSASMETAMPFVQASTSTLSAHWRRNYYFVDVPGFSTALEDPGPNRICYPRGTPWPIGPCPQTPAAVDDLTTAYWGGSEYTYDALANLPTHIGWQGGSTSRHAFVFADEPGQGKTWTMAGAAARLAGSGIKVHAYVSFPDDYIEIVIATGGTIHDLTAPASDPCP